ncbi:GlsB/YeaQ/YmgE family stress response membrane protein [Patescibacteria group bacterium]|nr:GlsB/YeaQ/YmgE family stress response membrane protein [Patescibacteria group bacterium]
MDWIVTIIVGGIIGWLAALLTKTREGLLAYILIGIIGSALGRWFFATVLGIGSAMSAGTFSWAGILWGVLGAVILTAILKFFHLLGSTSGASS